VPTVAEGAEAVMREKAKPTVQIDDDKVKVTRWDFLPGAATGWHRHEMNYVVVPLTDGTLTAEMPDGSIVENNLTVGASYVRPVGVEHNIINHNDGPYSFIEIELK
jgi:quercetin dioxygenase-like cupin family protein